MSIDDLNPLDEGGDTPSGADLLAGEYVLGVLDAAQRTRVRQRIDRDPGFARLVSQWEVRLAPWLGEIKPVDVPDHVWLRVRRQLGWAPVEGARGNGVWQSAGFWRGMTALAATLAVVAVLVVRVPQTTDTPVVVAPPVQVPPVTPPVEAADATKPVTPLLHDDGTPGWLASVDRQRGTVLMVPVPAAADRDGRVPELWLIPAGGTARSLGLVSIDRSHTVAVPASLHDDLVNGSVLAITLEPPGGAPQQVATGPIIAKGDLRNL